MIRKANKILSEAIVKEVKWDNKFIPCSGVSDIDRVNYFTNVNEDLLKKVRQAKAN